jgi:hypothetical protein
MDNFVLVELDPLWGATQPGGVLVLNGLAFLNPHDSYQMTSIGFAKFVVPIVIVERERVGNDDISCRFLRCGNSTTSEVIFGIGTRLLWFLASQSQSCSPLDPNDFSVDHVIDLDVCDIFVVVGLTRVEHDTVVVRKIKAGAGFGS